MTDKGDMRGILRTHGEGQFSFNMGEAGKYSAESLERKEKKNSKKYRQEKLLK